MSSSNTIHKLTFDVASTDRRTDGHAMSEWIRTALVPVIDKVIDHTQHEQNGGLKSRRIDKLEIDLGTVFRHEAATELSRRLHAKLSAALEFDVDVDIDIPLDNPKQSTRNEHFEQLHFFLRTGQIEWKYATHPSAAHHQLLQKVIDVRTRSSLERLRSLVLEAQTLTRMVKQFQTPQLFQLVRRFLEDWSEETSTAILHWLSMELVNIRSAPSTSILANYADKLWAWILPLTAENPITFSQFIERSSELTDETFTQNLARHRKALDNGRGMSEAMRSGLLEQVKAMQRDHFNRMDSTVTKHLNVRAEKAPSATLRQTLFATSSATSFATHDSSKKRDKEHDPRAQEHTQNPTHSSTAIVPHVTDWISIVDALITADDIILERYWIELFEIRPELIIQTRAQAWKRWLERLPIEKCIDLAAFLQPDVFHFLQSWENVRHQMQDKNSKHNHGEYADRTRLKMFIEQALPQLLEAAPMQLTVRDLLQHQDHFAEHVMAQMRTPFVETSELTSRSLLILHRELNTLLHAVEHPTESTPQKLSHTIDPHEVLHALTTTDVTFLRIHWGDIITSHVNAVREAYPRAHLQWLEQLSLTQLTDLAPLIQPSAANMMTRLLAQIPTALHQLFLRTKLPQLFLEPLDSVSPVQLLPTLREWLREQLPVGEVDAIANMAENSIDILNIGAKTTVITTNIDTGYTSAANDIEESELLYQALLNQDHALLASAWPKLLQTFPELIARARPVAWQGWTEELSDRQLHDIAQQLQVKAYTELSVLTSKFSEDKKQIFFKIALPHLLAAPPNTVQLTHLLANVNALRAVLDGDTDFTNTTSNTTALTDLPARHQANSLATRAWKENVSTERNEAHEARLLRALNEADSPFIEHHWQQILSSYTHLIVATQAQAWPKWIAHLSEEKCLALAHFLQKVALDFLFELTGTKGNTLSTSLSEKQQKALIPYLLSGKPSSISPSSLLAEFPFLAEQFAAQKDVVDRDQITRHENTDALINALLNADNATLDAHWQQIIHAQPHLIVTTQERAWSLWLRKLPRQKLRDIVMVLHTPIANIFNAIATEINATDLDGIAQADKREDIIRELFDAAFPLLLPAAAFSLSPQSMVAQSPRLASRLQILASRTARLATLVREHFAIAATQDPKGLLLNNVPEDFASSLNTILQEEKFEVLQTWWPKILLSHREALRKNWLLLSTEKKNRLVAVFSPSQQCDLVSVLQPHLAHFFYDYHQQLGKLINQAQLAKQQSVSDVKYEATPQFIKALEQARTLAIDAALSSTLQPEAPRLGVSTILQASLRRIVSEFPSMLDELNTPEMAQHSRHISAFFDAKNSIRRHMTEIDPDLHSFRLWQQGELAIADQDLNVAQLRRWLEWWMLHTTDIPETQQAPRQSTHIMLDTILEKSENSGQAERFLKLVLEALRLDSTIDLELITQQIESDEISQIDSAADASFVVDTRSPFLFTDSHNTPFTAQSRRLVEPMLLLEDIHKGELDIAYLNSAELTHLLQASEFYRSATSDSATSDMAAKDLVSCLETQAFAAQRPREVLQETLAAQLHQQVITTEDLLAIIRDQASPNKDFVENEDSQEHVKFAQALHWNRETQQQFRQLLDRGLRRSTTSYTSQPSARTLVSAREPHQTVIQKPAVSPLPPQMIESLSYRISTAILRRDLASLDLIWPEILRYHSDTLLQGLRRYLGQPQALQEFLKSRTVQQQLDMVHAISAKSSALLADLILAYEHRPQVFGQARSKEEWQALLVNTSLHFLIKNAAEPEAHLSTDVSVPVKSPSNMNERASLGALFTTLVSSTEKIDRDPTLLRKVATNWHDALASQDLPNLQSSLRQFLFDDAYLEKLMVQASAQGTSLASLSSWQSLYIEELLQTSPQLLEALLAKVGRGEVALSNLSTDAFHQLCHLRLGQHTETVQTTFWRKLITGFTKQNQSIDTIESSPSAIIETSISSKSSMTGSEEFSRNQYQESLQFLLSQPTIRAIESGVLSITSVINSGHSAHLVTVMPDLIQPEGLSFTPVDNGFRIRSGLSGVEVLLTLEKTDTNNEGNARRSYHAFKQSYTVNPKQAITNIPTTNMPDLVRHPRLNPKGIDKGIYKDIYKDINKNIDKNIDSGHWIKFGMAGVGVLLSIEMPDLVRHPRLNPKGIDKGIFKDINKDIDKAIDSEHWIKFGMAGVGVLLSIENTDLKDIDKSSVTYASTKQTPTINAIPAPTTNTTITAMPDLILHQRFDFRSINNRFQIKPGITDVQSSQLVENLNSYTTLAATTTRPKTLKRDSALRDEERLCLLLQTQQQISALDEQVMELLLQRLLSATAASTKYQSLISALLSRSALSRLFAHLPLSTIQRLLHQLAPSQAEILPAFAEQTLVALGHKSKNSTLIAWQLVFDALFAQGLLVRGERDRTAFIRSFVHALKHKTIIENEAQSVQKILSHFERARSVSKKEVKDAKDLSKRANPTIYKSAKDLLEENSMTPAIIGEAYVHNAGIVLVAPYLQRLWGILELTANGSFIDDTAAQRAVHLLQYIVTGKSETPEYQLVLNKLLCGIHGGLPIALGIDITSHEKEVIEQMLKGIIANWTALGTTSIQGLRETFLQRQAYLDYADDAWHMKVQPSTFDMLLDRLPWSFALIRFPWMTAPLHVTWR